MRVISHPFPLLRQFSSVLDIRLLTKEDNVSSDTNIARVTNLENISSLHQVHGNNAVLVTSPTSRTVKADCHATDRKNLSLIIRTADCQNILLFDPKKKVFALVHAGWKSMRVKVISSAIDLLKREWGSRPADLFVGAGPSLCMKCAEFTDPFTEAPELASFASGRHIDLKAAALDELQKNGVPTSQIDFSSECTRCEPEKYWTYRGGDRDKVMEGYENVLVATLIS
jgi:polyphenol oxidase